MVDNLTNNCVSYILLIPSLNPDNRLLELVSTVLQQSPEMIVIIIDDGSDPEFQWVFQQLETSGKCIVCHHQKNSGKGVALKTGIRYALEHFPTCTGIITADSDGQHSPADILKVATAIQEHPRALILGTRDFLLKNVPFKSRSGNRITSGIFKLATGKACPDTQTGLRGIPARYAINAESVAGERYEYEMNVLLQFAYWQIPFVEVPIETIYISENKGSHFRPVSDSARIYRVILSYWFTSLFGGKKSKSPLRFLVASLLSFVIDMSLFLILKALFVQRMVPAIFFATIIARLVSGIFNFTVNRKWVFRSMGSTAQQALGYTLLFVSQMLLSGALVSVLSFVPVPVSVVKIVVDMALFLVSYQIQRRFVFRKTHTIKGGRL